MFVDELVIEARAGNGGNGVVRWLREHARPWGGPAGGDGGRGGDVYLRAVRDIGLLARYRGEKEFAAGHGGAGESKSRHGRNGDDMTIDVPVGSIVTDIERGRRYELLTEGEVVRILSGGNGGLGNEYFKGSTNQAPTESTPGKIGESGTFKIELELAVDVGFVGLPNAGKSSILNALTNASSKVGAYPFTTLEPHLGSLYGFVLADIPGLIEGASEGKGLGHKFLRHIKRTKMLVHCVALDTVDPKKAYDEVRKELEGFDEKIALKPEWILLTKSDVTDRKTIEIWAKKLTKNNNRVFDISILDDLSVKKFSDALVQELESKNK